MSAQTMVKERNQMKKYNIKTNNKNTQKQKLQIALITTTAGMESFQCSAFKSFVLHHLYEVLS